MYECVFLVISMLFLFNVARTCRSLFVCLVFVFFLMLSSWLFWMCRCTKVSSLVIVTIIKDCTYPLHMCVLLFFDVFLRMCVSLPRACCHRYVFMRMRRAGGCGCVLVMAVGWRSIPPFQFLLLYTHKKRKNISPAHIKHARS